MRRLWQLILVLNVALTPMFASPRPDNHSVTRGARGADTKQNLNKKPAKKTHAAEESSDLRAEMAQLQRLVASQTRDLAEQGAQLQQQQQLVEALAERVRILSAYSDVPAVVRAQTVLAKPASAIADTVSEPIAAAGLSLPSAQAPQTQDEIGRRIEERVARIGPFTFSGDFRLRDEPFFGGPSNQALVRHRARLRARLNMNTRLNDEISGGLTIASGHIEDAISTNQDLDQFFTRKPLQLDRAFLTYTPHWLKPVSLTGGKFAIPWYRTELTWDNDVNVEGASQSISFALPKTPVLKRVGIVGFELPFAQTTGVNFNFAPGDNNRSTRLSVVYGAQLQTEWQLSPWLKLSAYTAFYDWHNADPIALSVNVPNPSSPNRGTLKLAGFSLQNSMTVWTQSTTVPTSGGATAAVNTSIVNAQFGSKFKLLDSIARFDMKTTSPKWPVILLADFVQNTAACANVANFLAPTPAAGATITVTTTAPCNPRDRQAYWLEGRFGRITEQHDWQFAYTRMFIEREAVMAAYNFSDLRQNSNVSQHRVEVFYDLYRNVQLGFTGLFGRPLRTGPPAETLLKRLQFDVLYRF